MKIPSLLALLALVAVPSRPARQAAPPTPSPMFRFETDEFWLNLHHFLYVLGRAEAKTRDASRAAVAGAPADAETALAGVTDEDRKVWRDAVAAYAGGLSRKDAVFDEPLPAITRALAGAGDRSTVAGVAIDPAVLTTLERAAPVYRKAWWPAHRAANRKWQLSVQALVARHGREILAFITLVYGLTWPAAGYPVHLSAYANWAGAYSTTGNLLVVSSLDPAVAGLNGLETVFHEGMHQWDDQIEAELREQARRIGRPVPANLSHAMIFFTAGEAVRRVAPDHVPYADAFGVWQRGMMPLKAALQEAWQPYLDGRGTREEALAALLGRATGW